MIEKFDEILNAFNEDEALKDAVKDIVDDCKMKAKWCIEYTYDENNQRVKDDNDEYIMKMPEAGSYGDNKMKAYLIIAKSIAKLVK